MNPIEKKILSKIDQYFPVLVFLLVSVIAGLIRISFIPILSDDAQGFLLPWYKTISQNGLYEQVGDYNLLYQFLIWIMTKLPLSPLYSYKILSSLGDYLLAIIAALLVYQIDSKNKLWSSIGVYSAVLLCPVVFLNSSAWAQCDSLFSAFAILGLYFLEKERYNFALISLGISFAFKLHAVFILPVYLFVYFSRRAFSIIRFSLIPVTMLTIPLPMLFWGRNILDTFSIYNSQTSANPCMAMNYPSFWAFLCAMSNAQQYHQLSKAAILFTVCILAFFMILWIQKQYITTGKNLIIMAFILAYTCVLFLPAMHDRYGYLYEVCAIILAFLIPKTIPLCLGLLLISLNTYGAYLFGISIDFTFLVRANIALFIAYYYVLKAEFQKSPHAPIIQS